MIKIASNVKISFMFPADWETAFTYYSHIPRLVEHLPHIDLTPLETMAEGEYRLYYHTVELGRYHIHVYCDIQVELDWENHTIHLLAVNNFPPVETNVTINSTSTRGYYSSVGTFAAVGDDETRIEYTLQLKANPPRPKGMRLVPGKIVDMVTHNITTNRMKEIADGFIKNSLQSFPAWRDAQKGL
ncbi:MAG: hypothetical protein IAE79_03840 [Anaerolinea sp.]|nr:hypothetical protein [Anaerolinea sp.]